MRRPACTDRVLRGVIALSQPLVADHINGVVSDDELKEYSTMAEVEDARVALSWAYSMKEWREGRTK